MGNYYGRGPKQHPSEDEDDVYRVQETVETKNETKTKEPEKSKGAQPQRPTNNFVLSRTSQVRDELVWRVVSAVRYQWTEEFAWLR